MNTYLNFSIGYILFWLVPFVMIGIFIFKMMKMEKKLKELESKES